MRFLAFLAILFIFLCGCTNQEGSGKDPDETGTKVRIGYVNTDPIYLISIDKRIFDTESYLKAEKTVFYQPPLTDILALTYLSLDREISKIGFKQPGMETNDTKIDEIVIQLMDEDVAKFKARLDEGASLADVAAEFGQEAPSEPQVITLGQTPDWDKVLQETNEGEISKACAVMMNGYGYIFQILKKGKFEDGTEWVEASIFAFKLQVNEAKKMIQDKIREKWNIQYTDKFYEALIKYYAGDVVTAYSILDDYLKGSGKSNGLAYYLKAHILQKRYEASGDKNLLEVIIESLNKAAKYINTNSYKPYVYYDLVQFYLAVGDKDNARKSWQTAISEIRDNLSLTRKLVEIAESQGDTEYVAIAKSKVSEMESQIKEEVTKMPRTVPRKGKVMTGEGELYEDQDQVLLDLENLTNSEQKFNFLNLIPEKTE